MADCGIGEVLGDDSGSTTAVPGSGPTLLVEGWADDVVGWVDDSDTPCPSGIADFDETIPVARVVLCTFLPLLMNEDMMMKLL